MADVKNVYQRLLEVQHELKAPRQAGGRFGKARNAEQILEAAKPVCYKHGLLLTTTDQVQELNGRTYVTATASVRNVDEPDELVDASANAWEGDISRGLDAPQVTGASSSYAKKYALQNLFAVDDSKDDPDHHTEPAAPVVKNTSTAAGGDELSRAKVAIFEALNEQGHETTLKQKAFITKVLGKSNIENLVEANLVADALGMGEE